jgi:ABC-type nitrate/sulfonate/bicarbonate transport system permease component
MKVAWRHAAIGICLLVALWELAVRWAWVNPLLVTAPSALPATYLQLARGGELAKHLGATLSRLGVAFFLGSSVGIVLGVAVAVWKIPGAVLEPLLRALHSTPKMALLPLAFALVGVGDASHELPALAACVAVTALHSMEAARNVPPRLVELARGYGATRWMLLRTVYVPACLPQIFTSLRIAVGSAMVLVIGAEMMTAQTGLGSLIWLAGQSFRMDRLYAAIILCGVMGVSAMQLITFLEKKIAPWEARA